MLPHTVKSGQELLVTMEVGHELMVMVGVTMCEKEVIIGAEDVYKLLVTAKVD